MAGKVRQNKISLEMKLGQASPVSYSCKFGNTNSKKYMHANIHSSIIYNCQDMETAYMSTNRWMNKENVIFMCVYTHTQQNTIHPYTRTIVSFAKRWMILKGIMLKWNRSDRERQRQWYHLHVKSKSYNKAVNMTKKKRETQINREQTSGTSGEREGREDSVGLGD